MPRVIDPPRWSLPTLESASGCFETMRAYGGQIFRLTAHLGRLYASAQYLGVQIPQTTQQLGQRLRNALAASGMREALVRVALIPNAERLASPSIVVHPVHPPPREFYQRGIHVAVVPTKKFPVSQIDPQSKFSARLGSVLATMEAQLRDADEAVFLDALGCATESTASNLGIISHGVFVAPPCWQGLLAGITWQVVVELADDLKIPYRETPLTRHELYNADEAFLTSTTKEILPITVIDGRRIGMGKPGPYTRRLHRAFRQLVRKELGRAEGA